MARLRFALAAITMAFGVHPAMAFPRSTPPGNACLAHAPEAAMRSGLAVEIITRVMLAESGGNAKAVSPKGAIGCMQIMPATWAYLSQRYGLGADPFDARMNMVGGALYLAELTRKFGLRGAYAAYNAGPARYARYVVNGLPLPSETVAYAARLGGAAAPAIAERSRARWQEASLFLERGGGQRSTATEVARQEPAAAREASALPEPSEEPRRARIAALFPLTADASRDQR